MLSGKCPNWPKMIKKNTPVYRICYEKSSWFDFKYQFNSKPKCGKVNNVIKYKLTLKTKLKLKGTSDHANRGYRRYKQMLF